MNLKVIRITTKAHNVNQNPLLVVTKKKIAKKRKDVVWMREMTTLIRNYIQAELECWMRLGVKVTKKRTFLKWIW